MEQKQSRLLGIDIIKSLATVFVLILHVNGYASLAIDGVSRGGTGYLKDWHILQFIYLFFAVVFLSLKEVVLKLKAMSGFGFVLFL